jgi:hypothetical protein
MKAKGESHENQDKRKSRSAHFSVKPELPALKEGLHQETKAAPERRLLFLIAASRTRLWLASGWGSRGRRRPPLFVHLEPANASSLTVRRGFVNHPVSETAAKPSPFASNQVVDLLFSITVASRKIWHGFGLQLAIDNSERDESERRKP